MNSTGTALDNLVNAIARQQWLQPAENAVERLVDTLVDKPDAPAGPVRQRIVNLLSGTFLGHPLHPALIAVPLGAWTATEVLDGLEMLGRKEMGAGADATLAVGLAGALLAAPCGLSDWHYTTDRPHRVGVVHGLVNISAALLYTASLVQRRRGARGWGRVLAFSGAAIATAGGYLGGVLAYGERIGVNHAADQPAPADFTPVLPEGDLPEREPKQVDVKGTPVLLVRDGSQIYAIGAVCSHLGGPLAEGKLEGDQIVCPWHFSHFSIKDGSVQDGPATFPEPCYAVRVHNGQIEVAEGKRG